MFSTLKLRLKMHFARLIYNVATVKYEAQTWTRTTSCPACFKLIPIDAHFCADCGHHLVTHTDIQNVPVKSEIPTTLPAFQLPNTDPIQVAVISMIMPQATMRDWNRQDLDQDLKNIQL